MSSSVGIRTIPFDLRARFNALFILQQYLPARRDIAARKELVRREIAAHLVHSGEGRTFEVERIADLSRAEFRRRFLRRGLPVIFAGAAATWPCARTWSFESFRQRFGDEQIEIVERQGTTEKDLNGHAEISEQMNFGDFLDSVMSGGSKYLRFSPLLEKFPDLLNDLDQRFLQSMAPANLGTSYLLFIGGSETSTALHNEMTPLFIVNVCGVKRWTMISNSYMPILDPKPHGLGYNHSEANLWNMNEEQFPGLRSVDRMEAVMQPGDVLFVPAWAWHYVRNDSPHIGVRCGLIHPSMMTSSPTLAWVRLFATRDPSIGEVLYNVIFKKYVPEDRLLPNPRIYWRGRATPSS